MLYIFIEDDKLVLSSDHPMTKSGFDIIVAEEPDSGKMQVKLSVLKNLLQHADTDFIFCK